MGLGLGASPLRGRLTLSKEWKTSVEGDTREIQGRCRGDGARLVEGVEDLGGGLVDGGKHVAAAAVREARHLLHDHCLGLGLALGLGLGLP